MLLFWSIRYWDRAIREFRDRYLRLDTATLPPVTRAEVEFVAESDDRHNDRRILSYRHLFVEKDPKDEPANPWGYGQIIGVGPSEYFEDEAGQEILYDQLGQVLTGSPTARVVPAGARQHDLDLMAAPPTPIPVQGVSLSTEDFRVLAIFTRDLRELLGSAFRRHGPGKLNTDGTVLLAPNSQPRLETAATGDEIGSFVTIFRRLYMPNEEADFKKATDVFVRAICGHSYATWVSAVVAEYKAQLDAIAWHGPPIPQISFKSKRLIDVFINTQYAHQPKPDRQRQFGECLAEVYGHRAALDWLFLSKLQQLAIYFGNAGRVVAWWFGLYCDKHGISPDVVAPLRDVHPGLGSLETADQRRDRLLGEAVERLAQALWEQDGRPEGGPEQYLARAREQLIRRLDRRD
jgi:hypothetical protein